MSRNCRSTPACAPICCAEMLESRFLLSGGRVVGYLPEYRFGLFNSIDLGSITHLNYFSILANGNGSLSTSGHLDTGHLDTAVAAAHARGVTVSVVVDPGSAFTTFDPDMNKLILGLAWMLAGKAIGKAKGAPAKRS